MIRNSKYWKKNAFLLAGFGLVLLISYPMAISKTIELQAANRALIDIQDSQSITELDLRLLKSRIAKLDSVYGLVSMRNYEGALLDFSSKTSAKHGLQVENLHQDQRSGALRIDRLRVQGGFHEMLLFLRDFCVQFNAGIIRSANLELSKSGPRSSEKLYLDIYVEKIEIGDAP